MNIYTISSFSDIDIDVLFTDFVDNGVFVLRGYHMDKDEQHKLMMLFGDRAKWYPNSDSDACFTYVENHAMTILHNSTLEQFSNLGNNDVLISWHMEHLGFPNPAVGASWNMHTFTCSPESGKTLFVDAIKLCSLLDDEELLFLSRCLYVETWPWEGEYQKPILSTIKQHRLSRKNMVHIQPDVSYREKLYYALTNQPTNDERERFEKILCRISQAIVSDKSLQIEHRWQQNDVVVADLSRMYHAVLGGFTPEQREFHGIWAHARPGDTFSFAQ